MPGARTGSLKHVRLRKTMRKIGTVTLGVPLGALDDGQDLSRSASRRPAKVTIPFGTESRQSILERRQPLTVVGPKHAIGGPRRSKP